MTTPSLVHQAALGDSVLLIPLFRSLRQRFPGCAITLVTRPNLGQMLQMLGFIEAYASAEDREHTAWFAPPEGSDRPNSSPAWAQADYLLSAVAAKGDAWCANALWARPDYPLDSLLFFNPRPPEDYPRHVTAWHREQLAALELIESPPPLPKLNPDGVVVIHAGRATGFFRWAAT